MNLKKAKFLRKKAKEIAPMQETKYERDKKGSIFVHPYCVRGVYLTMKDEVKKK